jgi:hypothetical protein
MEGLGVLDAEVGGIVEGETGDGGGVELGGHVLLGGLLVQNSSVEWVLRGYMTVEDEIQ